MYSTKIREKSIGMTSHLRLLTVFMVAAAAFILAITAPELWANDEDDGDEKPFAEANIFFELNNTDGDLGIHALIDGEPWKRLEIEDPRERGMLDIRVKGRLRRQGLTEIFFESAEPPFESDDPSEVTLTPERFFRRFPEGEYVIEGITIEGDELESTAELTHLLPAPPDNIEVAGITAAEDCDADPLPSVAPSDSGSVTISWDPVTESHPELGRTGEPIEVVKYQVVVEREEPTLLIFSVDLPPTATEVEIPGDFIALGDEFKFEILVREASGNQTAVESCFEVDEDE
ncbi:MAG: hypothetical protein ACYS0I_11875 [Planctomycetota bacterium]|jgi:hypothetical protein